MVRNGDENLKVTVTFIFIFHTFFSSSNPG